MCGSKYYLLGISPPASCSREVSCGYFVLLEIFLCSVSYFEQILHACMCKLKYFIFSFVTSNIITYKWFSDVGCAKSFSFRSMSTAY